MTWSARQYTSFEAERTRPVRDLLHARAQSRWFGVRWIWAVVPGNSTEVLAAAFPDADSHRPRQFRRHDRGGAQTAAGAAVRSG